MELYQRFDLLINHVQRQIEVPKNVRVNLEGDLKFFRTQALCDLDRRERSDILRMRWAELIKVLKGSSVMRGFNQDTSFWTPIGIAFGFPSTEPAQKKTVQPVPRANESEAVTPDADKLLGAMAERARTIPVISESERLAAYLGLRFLESEAKKNRPHRNNQEIRRVWAQIEPILDRVNLLDKYKSDINIQHRIGFFLKDGF